METYGDRIKELREAKGLSQAQLAKALDVSQGAITFWETNSRVPSADAIVALANFFGVTSDYILGLSDK